MATQAHFATCSTATPGIPPGLETLRPLTSSTSPSSAAPDRVLAEVVSAALRAGLEAFHEVRSRCDASPHRISVAADAPRPGPGERTAHRLGGHPADPPARDRPRHPPRVAAFQAGAFPLAREKPEGHPCIVRAHAAGGQTISSSPIARRGLYQLTCGRVRWRLAWAPHVPYRSEQMTDHARHYAFPHAGADERRRLELFAERLDPLTVRRITALGLSPGARCLEVGGGRGSIARWLCEYVGPAGRVTATDLDTGFLAELLLPNLEVLRHDVTSDEFPAGSFDLVHVRAVLMHIPDRMRVLRRMVSWLAPGGWLLAEDCDFGMWLGDFGSFSILVPGTRYSRTGRWRKAGRFSGRSSSWSWRLPAPTPSSTSCSREPRYRSSTDSASPPWPGR